MIGKGARCPPPVHRLALDVGRRLAQLHPRAVLVCGGLGGVMAGAARGMTSAGGVAIGLIPAGHTPNEHLTFALRLGLPLVFRDIVTACASDVVVVLPGSHGTMIEGWTAEERGVPLLGVGDHSGWPTATLPLHKSGLTPAELPGFIAGLLGLAPDG